VVGYKTHAKLMMIVRREQGKLKRYVHLGTGNYHPGTARAYTDFGLLSCNRELGEDVHRMFQQLTGLGRAVELHRLLQAPFTLHKTLLELIDQEAENARKGLPARILAKMNSLSEPQIIQALYRASQSGVQVDLVIRGICRLRPGVPGVSENVRVVSVVGRFLEHSRIFYFHANGEERTYLSSADLMERNLFRRVETAFPLDDARQRARVIEEGLAISLADNVQSWELSADGAWTRRKPGKAEPVCAQSWLRERLSGGFEDELDSAAGEEGGFALEIGSGQGAGVQPARGKGQREARRSRLDPKGRKRRGGSSSVKPKGKPKKHGKG
jgi:polyphosphate kinase